MSEKFFSCTSPLFTFSRNAQPSFINLECRSTQERKNYIQRNFSNFAAWGNNLHIEAKSWWNQNQMLTISPVRSAMPNRKSRFGTRTSLEVVASTLLSASASTSAVFVSSSSLSCRKNYANKNSKMFLFISKSSQATRRRRFEHNPLWCLFFNVNSQSSTPLLLL